MTTNLEDYSKTGDITKNIITSEISTVISTDSLLDVILEDMVIPSDSNSYLDETITITEYVTPERFDTLRRFPNIILNQTGNISETGDIEIEYTQYKYYVGSDLTKVFLGEYERIPVTEKGVGFRRKQKLEGEENAKLISDLKCVQISKQGERFLYKCTYNKLRFESGYKGASKEVSDFISLAKDEENNNILRSKGFTPIIDNIVAYLTKQNKEVTNYRIESYLKEYVRVFRPTYYGVILQPTVNYSLSIIGIKKYINIESIYFAVSHLLDISYKFIYQSHLSDYMVSNNTIDRNKKITFISNSQLGFPVINAEKYVKVCERRGEPCVKIAEHLVYTNKFIPDKNNVKYIKNNISAYGFGENVEVTVIDEKFTGIPPYIQNPVLFLNMDMRSREPIEYEYNVYIIKSKPGDFIRNYYEWIIIRQERNLMPDIISIYSNIPDQYFSAEGVESPITQPDLYDFADQLLASIPEELQQYVFDKREHIDDDGNKTTLFFRLQHYKGSFFEKYYLKYGDKKKEDIIKDSKLADDIKVYPVYNNDENFKIGALTISEYIYVSGIPVIGLMVPSINPGSSQKITRLSSGDSILTPYYSDNITEDDQVLGFLDKDFLGYRKFSFDDKLLKDFNHVEVDMGSGFYTMHIFTNVSKLNPVIKARLIKKQFEYNMKQIGDKLQDISGIKDPNFNILYKGNQYETLGDLMRSNSKLIYPSFIDPNFDPSNTPFTYEFQGMNIIKTAISDYVSNTSSAKDLYPQMIQLYFNDINSINITIGSRLNYAQNILTNLKYNSNSKFISNVFESFVYIVYNILSECSFVMNETGKLRLLEHIFDYIHINIMPKVETNIQKPISKRISTYEQNIFDSLITGKFSGDKLTKALNKYKESYKELSEAENLGDEDRIFELTDIISNMQITETKDITDKFVRKLLGTVSDETVSAIRYHLMRMSLDDSIINSKYSKNMSNILTEALKTILYSEYLYVDSFKSDREILKLFLKQFTRSFVKFQQRDERQLKSINVKFGSSKFRERTSNSMDENSYIRRINYILSIFMGETIVISGARYTEDDSIDTVIEQDIYNPILTRILARFIGDKPNDNIMAINHSKIISSFFTLYLMTRNDISITNNLRAILSHCYITFDTITSGNKRTTLICRKFNGSIIYKQYINETGAQTRAELLLLLSNNVKVVGSKLIINQRYLNFLSPNVYGTSMDISSDIFVSRSSMNNIDNLMYIEDIARLDNYVPYNITGSEDLSLTLSKIAKDSWTNEDRSSFLNMMSFITKAYEKVPDLEYIIYLGSSHCKLLPFVSYLNPNLKFICIDNKSHDYIYSDKFADTNNRYKSSGLILSEENMETYTHYNRDNINNGIVYLFHSKFSNYINKPEDEIHLNIYTKNKNIENASKPMMNDYISKDKYSFLKSEITSIKDNFVYDNIPNLITEVLTNSENVNNAKIFIIELSNHFEYDIMNILINLRQSGINNYGAFYSDNTDKLNSNVNDYGRLTHMVDNQICVNSIACRFSSIVFDPIRYESNYYYNQILSRYNTNNYVNIISLNENKRYIDDAKNRNIVYMEGDIKLCPWDNSNRTRLEITNYRVTKSYNIDSYNDLVNYKNYILVDFCDRGNYSIPVNWPTTKKYILHTANRNINIVQNNELDINNIGIKALMNGVEMSASLTVDELIGKDIVSYLENRLGPNARAIQIIHNLSNYEIKQNVSKIKGATNTGVYVTSTYNTEHINDKLSFINNKYRKVIEGPNSSYNWQYELKVLHDFFLMQPKARFNPNTINKFRDILEYAKLYTSDDEIVESFIINQNMFEIISLLNALTLQVPKSLDVITSEAEYNMFYNRTVDRYDTISV